MPGRLRSILALLVVVFAGCAGHTQSTARIEKRANENAAQLAAANWLKLLDTGDYGEAFEWEAQDFRLSRTQAQFVRYMQAHRSPFGHALSRSVIGAAFVHKLVGLPDGDYESVIFKTAFARKAATAERVILIKQGPGWRVIDYRIY